MANFGRLPFWTAAASLLSMMPAVFGFARGINAQAETPTATVLPQAQVLSPRPGQALQGSVPVEIGIAGSGYQSVEISFAYANYAEGGSFLIYSGSLPQDPAALQEPITQWNTGVITDGDYILYVDLYLPDGSSQRLEVPGLRVRNYSPIETDTPAPPTAAITPAPTGTPPSTLPAATQPAAIPPGTAAASPTLAPTLTPTPTPTPPAAGMPARNPAELEAGQVWLALARGAIAAVGLFAVGILYFLIRRLGRYSL